MQILEYSINSQIIVQFAFIHLDFLTIIAFLNKHIYAVGNRTITDGCNVLAITLSVLHHLIALNSKKT